MSPKAHDLFTNGFCSDPSLCGNLSPELQNPANLQARALPSLVRDRQASFPLQNPNLILSFQRSPPYSCQGQKVNQLFYVSKQGILGLRILKGAWGALDTRHSTISKSCEYGGIQKKSWEDWDLGNLLSP